MAIRAVLDTNIIIAARRAKTADSTNAEILERWEAGEFVLLHTRDVLLEYAEKLAELNVPEELTVSFMARVVLLGEPVRIEFFHLPHYPVDSDDIAFLLCALNGDATHLVTNDQHLLILAPSYVVKICEPDFFLMDLRRE